MTELKFYKLHDDIVIHNKATMGSACFDLAYMPHGKNSVAVYKTNNALDNRPINMKNGSFTIAPGERALLPTGLIADIPDGFSLRVHIRSSMAYKQGIFLANSEGVIDSDYFHELFLMVFNGSSVNVTIEPGTRIAQGELVPVINYDIVETDVRPSQKTDRIGGIGSTGATEIISKKTKTSKKGSS